MLKIYKIYCRGDKDVKYDTILGFVVANDQTEAAQIIKERLTDNIIEITNVEEISLQKPHIEAVVTTW